MSYTRATFLEKSYEKIMQLANVGDKLRHQLYIHNRVNHIYYETTNKKYYEDGNKLLGRINDNKTLYNLSLYNHWETEVAQHINAFENFCIEIYNALIKTGQPISIHPNDDELKSFIKEHLLEPDHALQKIKEKYEAFILQITPIQMELQQYPNFYPQDILDKIPQKYNAFTRENITSLAAKKFIAKIDLTYAKWQQKLSLVHDIVTTSKSLTQEHEEKTKDQNTLQEEYYKKIKIFETIIPQLLKQLHGTNVPPFRKVSLNRLRSLATDAVEQTNFYVKTYRDRVEKHITNLNAFFMTLFEELDTEQNPIRSEYPELQLFITEINAQRNINLMTILKKIESAKKLIDEIAKYSSDEATQESIRQKYLEKLSTEQEAARATYDQNLLNKFISNLEEEICKTRIEHEKIIEEQRENKRAMELASNDAFKSQKLYASEKITILLELLDEKKYDEHGEYHELFKTLDSITDSRAMNEHTIELKNKINQALTRKVTIAEDKANGMISRLDQFAPDDVVFEFLLNLAEAKESAINTKSMKPLDDFFCKLKFAITYYSGSIKSKPKSADEEIEEAREEKKPHSQEAAITKSRFIFWNSRPTQTATTTTTRSDRSLNGGNEPIRQMVTGKTAEW